MKKLYKLSLLCLILLTAIFALPGPVHAQSPNNGNGKVVFGESYHLNQGELLDGDLAVFGGNAVIDPNATVNGSVIITGGSIEINGEITGDVTSVGGATSLGSTAVIHGNLTTVGVTVHRDNGAQVLGSVVNGAPGNFNLLNLPRVFERNLLVPGVIGANPLKPLGDALWWVFVILAGAALTALVVLFMPEQTTRVARSMVAAPIISGAFGLLTLIVAPAMLFILIITIILSPVGLVGVLAFILALVFGWIAFSLELGGRLAASIKADWAPPVRAGLGSLVIMIISLVPCVGWVLGFVISIMGIGAVLTSRFGTRVYATATPYSPAAPARPIQPMQGPFSPTPAAMSVVPAAPLKTPSPGPSASEPPSAEPSNNEPVPPDAEK